VWTVLADIPGQPRWMTDLKHVDLLDPPPVGVGTRAVGRVRVFGIAVDDPVTVTAWEPGSRFGIRHDGLFRGDGEITLEPSVDGSVVRWSERLVAPVLPHLAGVVGGPILRRVFAADLERLRELVERGDV
jgi:hypothetical protein